MKGMMNLYKINNKLKELIEMKDNNNNLDMDLTIYIVF
jgi:hypothetical protein